MRFLTIFLAFFMLLPLGAQRGEISERNEVERIEYLTQSDRLYLNHENKKIKDDVRTPFLNEALFSLEKSSHLDSFPIQRNKKIYLFQKSLLL